MVYSRVSKSNISVLVCDKLLSKTHRMHRRIERIKSKVHTIRFMLPCGTNVFQKSRTSVVVHDKLQKKTHRMRQVTTLLFYATYALLESQQVLKLREDKLYTIVNSFDKYVLININITIFAFFFFFYYKNINLKH